MQSQISLRLIANRNIMKVIGLLCLCLASAYAAPDTSCSAQVRGLEEELSNLRGIFKQLQEDVKDMKAVVDDEGMYCCL